MQFHRQVPILDYIVDFYCHEIKLAIEINGSSHEWKVEYDKLRAKRLKATGVSTLVFDDLDVKRDINWVLNQIVEYLQEAAR